MRNKLSGSWKVDKIVLIAFGGNIPAPGFSDCIATLKEALNRLQDGGLDLAALSRWYRTAPVPASNQAWYVNAVARFEIPLQPSRAPADILTLCHRVEGSLERRRDKVDGARTVDLDLLAMDRLICGWQHGDTSRGAVVPHPRLHERLFVLAPLCDVWPQWRHPVLGRTAAELLAALPAGQQAEVIAEP